MRFLKSYALAASACTALLFATTTSAQAASGCAAFNGTYKINTQGHMSTGVFYGAGFRAGDVITFSLTSKSGAADITPRIYDATTGQLLAGGGRWVSAPKSISYKLSAANAGHTIDASAFEYHENGGSLAGKLSCKAGSAPAAKAPKAKVAKAAAPAAAPVGTIANIFKKPAAK